MAWNAVGTTPDTESQDKWKVKAVEPEGTPMGAFTNRNNQPELLPMLAEGGKELLQGLMHTAGTLMDVGTFTAPGAGSHAERWASKIETDPSMGGRVDPSGEIHPDQVSHAYDSAFGTGPLAQTLKERVPQAVEAISPVAPVAEGLTGLLGRVSAPAEAALRAPVGQARQAFSAVKTAEETSARNMAAANPQVEQALLDRTGFRTGSGQGVAKAVAGEEAGPALQGHNQAIGNTVLAGEANVPAGTPLSYEATEAARKGPNSVYDRVARTIPEGAIDPAALNGAGRTTGGLVTSSDAAKAQIKSIREQLTEPMTGQQKVDNLRSLRQEGFKRIASEDVDQQAVGYAQLHFARAIEDDIGRNLPRNGPVSLEQFQLARKTLAKNHAIEAALKGGDVDLKAIGRLQRADPDLLDAGMKDVADFVNSREGSAVVGIPNALKEPGLSGRALDAVDLHHPVKGAARFFGGGTARKALTGDTGAAVDAAVSRYKARPERFDPQPGLTPPPGRAWREPEQIGLGDLAQGSGPAPWTLDEGANPSPTKPKGSRGDVPLADVLSQGVERSPSTGLSMAPRPRPDDLSFRFSPEVVGERPAQGGSPKLGRAVDDYGNALDLEKSNSPGAQWEAAPARGRMSLGDRLAPEGQGQQEPGVLYQGRAGGPKTPTTTREPQLHQGAGVPDDTATRTGSSPKVTHEVDEDTGAHVFRTTNGELHAQENGPYLMGKRSDTATGAQGKGEGTARIEAGVEQAEHRGLIWGSDVSVSEAQAKVYQRMERMGYNVTKNPFTTNTHVKNGQTYKTFVSKNPRKPVFEVSSALAKAVGQ